MHVVCVDQMYTLFCTCQFFSIILWFLDFCLCLCFSTFPPLHFSLYITTESICTCIVPYVHGTIQWSLTGPIFLKKSDSPHHNWDQFQLAPDLGVGIHKVTTIFVGILTAWYWTDHLYRNICLKSANSIWHLVWL